jgi:hypothetical protein
MHAIRYGDLQAIFFHIGSLTIKSECAISDFIHCEALILKNIHLKKFIYILMKKKFKGRDFLKLIIIKKTQVESQMLRKTKKEAFLRLIKNCLLMTKFESFLQ